MRPTEIYVLNNTEKTEDTGLVIHEMKKLSLVRDSHANSDNMMGIKNHVEG